MSWAPETLDKVLKGSTARLMLRCQCGHIGSISKDEALARFGPGASPRAVRFGRYRCTACGSRKTPHPYV